jgi:ribosomal protein L37AE/L43A
MPMNIIQTMESKQLFSRTFRPRGLLKKVDSWARWKVFLAGLFGLPLDPAGVEVWQKHTGRDAPTGLFSESYVIAGRRSGKSVIASLIAVFLAAFKNYDDVLNPGEIGTLAVIASDKRQARTIFNYIRTFFRMPMLRSLVVSELKESITLSNHVKIEIHTCSFRSVRGYSLIGVIADEAAFWESESSANPAAEVLNAVRPGLATTNGLLLVISSPYSKIGPLYENYREHFGKSDSPILVWKGTSLEMNPTLPAKVVERALARDRAAAAAEYLAEFRDDIGGFLSIEEIERVIVTGRSMLPCISGQQYRAFCDPSGGRSDAMTLGIAHGEGERAILDLLREVSAPFSPQEAVREFCQLLKGYRISEVMGDRYSAQWVQEEFERHGVRYLPSEKNRSELYLEFLPALTSGQIELLDNERMKQQFGNLQRRTTGGGRDSVDHGVGGHDDLSNAAAGALCRVLQSNASGMLGLLDLVKDIDAGKRLMPKTPQELAIVAVTRAHREPLVKKPECPVCGKTETVLPMAVAGGWQCNQCGVSLDGNGKLTSEPRREVIGVTCCGDAAEVFKKTNKPHVQPIGSEVRCIACGRQSGRDARDPEPRGVSRRDFPRLRGQFAIRADVGFKNTFGRFG